MRFFGLPLVLVLALPAAGGATFRRGSDILNIGGKSVSKKAIVNVLGRWDSHQDWNGRRAQLDEFREITLRKMSKDRNGLLQADGVLHRKAAAVSQLLRAMQARRALVTTTLKLPFTDAALGVGGASVESSTPSRSTSWRPTCSRPLRLDGRVRGRGSMRREEGQFSPRTAASVKTASARRWARRVGTTSACSRLVVSASRCSA